jgi:hypothetical protein
MYQVSVDSFVVLRRVRKMRKATISFGMSVRSSVRLPVRMEQFGFQWMDFDEIWYLRLFRKSVEKFQVSLKSAENNGYLTLRLYICDNITLNFS